MRLRDDLLRLKGQLGAATDDAMKIALKIEGYFTQIKAMEKRLERVEGAVGIRR